MSHFAGKDALTHVQEKKEEIHGNEITRPQAHAYIAASLVAVTLLFVWTAFGTLFSLKIFMALSAALIAWETGRAGFLAWSKLQRLHRLIEQEKYEIEHHRPQEREELVALYSSKGFQGKLLEDVVDTLMADSDRLLKVMLEEEMGLALEVHDHPLKQACGAFCGGIAAALLLLALHLLFPLFGLPLATLLVIATAALLWARHEGNLLLNALVWNLALLALSFGLLYFLL